MVLYVLVCGALPFDGSTLQSLRDRVLSGRFRIPFFMSSECEHLIRRMLVLEPTRRYTIEQIKHHRWMCPELLEHAIIAKYNLNMERQSVLEPSEDILCIMSEYVGIAPDKTRASLKKNTYDHVAAIYLLLQDRVSHKKEQSKPSGDPAANRLMYKSSKQALLLEQLPTQQLLQLHQQQQQQQQQAQAQQQQLLLPPQQPLPQPGSNSSVGSNSAYDLDLSAPRSTSSPGSTTGDLGGAAFPCMQCTASFATREQLEQHQLLHSPNGQPTTQNVTQVSPSTVRTKTLS